MIVLLAGAVGSFGLMVHAGRRQRSLMLIGLFTVRELSPFVALVCVHVVSKHWPVLTRATLYSLMPVLTLGSLAIYGYIALGPPRPQPAFVFLVVPLQTFDPELPVADSIPKTSSRLSAIVQSCL